VSHNLIKLKNLLRSPAYPWAKAVFLNLFLTCGTLNIRENLAAHRYKEIKKDQVKPLCYIPNAFFSPKIIVKVKTNKLAAHLEVAHGTPVEKHWAL